MGIAALPLVPNTFEPILQGVTLQMLGINPTTDPAAYSEVRIGWQTAGQPWMKDPDADVCILRSVEEDDNYNRIRDREVISNLAADPTGFTVILQDVYTRVWRVFWVLYGPNSFDHARMIRSGLFNDFIHDALAGSNVYLVTDVSAPRRVPEVDNNQWFERVDFSALFNEKVTEQVIVGTVKSVEVVVYSSDGVAPISDVIITGSVTPVPPPLPVGTVIGIWTDGTGVPSTLQNDGDYYLNLSTGDVYLQVAGAWGSPVGNIKGGGGSEVPSSTYHKVSAAGNNAATVKNTPGIVTGWKIYNNAAYPIYVKIFNKASIPSPGADSPQQVIGVDAGLGEVSAPGPGVTYAAGIGIAITKGIADSDNTAILANDCTVDVFYQ